MYVYLLAALLESLAIVTSPYRVWGGETEEKKSLLVVPQARW